MPQMDKANAAGFFRAFVAAFPDISHSIEDVIADGDRVGARLWCGARTRPSSWACRPRTSDRHYRINMFRLKDGRIVDQQINSDGVGMMMQLGLIPGPEQEAVV